MITTAITTVSTVIATASSGDIKKQHRKKTVILPLIAMGSCFVIAIGGALLITPLFIAEEMQAFGTDGSEEKLSNILYILVGILCITAVVLFVARRLKLRTKAFVLKLMFYSAVFFILTTTLTPIIDYGLAPPPEPKEGEEDSGNVWNFMPIEDGVRILKSADLDTDKQPELILVDLNGTTISIYEGHNLTLVRKLYFQNLTPITNVAIADVINNNLNNNTLNNTLELIVVSGSNNDNETKLFVIETVNYTIIVETDLNNLSELKKIDIEPIVIAELTGNYDELLEKIYGFNRTVISNNLTKVEKLDNDRLVCVNRSGYVFVLSNTTKTKLWSSKQFATTGIATIAVADWFDPDQNRPEIFVLTPAITTATATITATTTTATVTTTITTTTNQTTRIFVYDSYTYRLEWDSGDSLADFRAYALVVLDRDSDGVIDIIIGTSSGLVYADVKFITLVPEYETSSIPCLISVFIAFALTLLLYYYPEWYVIDSVGLTLAAGICALIGISLAILPLIVLLLILAVYDAISVYKTKHMVELADSVVEFKLPIILVIPRTLKYSYLKQQGLQPEADAHHRGSHRRRRHGALFMGLGDIILPGTIVIAAYRFLASSPYLLGFIPANLFVAICTLIGILLGFTTLMTVVVKGKPHAGLPFLNFGAISAYFISYFIAYQDLTFGLVLRF